MPSDKLLESPLRGGVFDYDLDNKLRDPIEEFDSTRADSEIALQTMLVRLPDEPLLVNGQPFGFRINEQRLANAINDMRISSAGKGRFDPQVLTISLVEAQPGRFSPSDPEVEEGQTHSYKNNGINLVVPRDIVKSDVAMSDLVRDIEAVFNKDLEAGMEQNAALKQYFFMRKMLNQAGVVLSGAVGEGVGVATANGAVGESLLRGSAGALLGAIAYGGAVAAKRQFDKRKHGNTVEPIARRAYRFSKKQRKDEVYASDGYVRKYFRQGPIISLVPISESSS